MLRNAFITCLLIASVRGQDIPPSNLEDSSEITSSTTSTIEPTTTTSATITTTAPATSIVSTVSSSPSDSITSTTVFTPITTDVDSTLPSTTPSTTLTSMPSTTPSMQTSSTNFVTSPSTSSVVTAETFPPSPQTTTTQFPLKPFFPNTFQLSYCYFRSLRGHPKLQWSYYGCHWVHPTYCHRCCYYDYSVFAGCTNVDSFYCQKLNYNDPHNVFRHYSVNSLFY